MRNNVRFLYLGDIMGEAGLSLVEKELPKLRNEKKIDIIIAQAENVTDGRGTSPEDFSRLRKSGVDFCSGGNWTLWRKTIIPMLSDPNQPIIRPANYPAGTPGLGWKYFSTGFGKVLVVSLLGKTVGRDSKLQLDNPLQTIDRILETEAATEKVATIINFHGDFSSEKVVIGHYLNGRVTAAIGDHWHVPTADGRVLSSGTAHITDVGMVGILEASLGVKTEVIIDRWRNDMIRPNELETTGTLQLNGFIFDVDPASGKSVSAESIRQIYK